MTNAKKTIKKILEQIDVKINGSRPWDIQVYNERFYNRVLAGGSLALGESYMDGWWKSKQLDELITKLLKAELDKKIKPWKIFIPAIKAKVFNLQPQSRAKNIAKKHYDIGNDLYENMLDKRMIYTCGYWEKASNLDEAQEAKLDLVCKKIGLKAGQQVLDIGCGWGGFAKFAAERYGAQVTGITVSKEQVSLAKKLCAGLPVEIRLQDYREINQQFDHIVSLGMFEHVGPKNYRTFMRIVAKNLKIDGFFLLHTIGGNESVNQTDPWIDKYIFPNGVIPSIKQVASAFEGIFIMEDWHNFGLDYDQTLMAWYQNFIAHWDRIKNQYDERFKRMWTFYLLTSAGAFRARKNQLWQIIFSKQGTQQRLQSIR